MKSKERDEKGDVNFKLKPFDWKKFNQKRHTYIFHYYDAKREMHRPYFDLFSFADERFENAKRQSEFCELNLYASPEQPPYDFHIQYSNYQLKLLMTFFKEVFNVKAFIEGVQPSHKYLKIILPKRTKNQILNFINDFELLWIKDLVFEIIATAQNIYVEEVAHWERPEMQKIIKTADEEAKKAIKIIEKVTDKTWLSGKKKKPAELLYINFVFQDGSTRIEHPWLAKEFVEHFKEHFNDLSYKNWRVDLERYPQRFESNIIAHEFKYRLAKSLYNMLTKANFFKVSNDQPYPNKLMLCIARLIEFCLIPVGSFDETDSVKVRHIRNWIKRKTFNESIISATLPANVKKLKKYFDEDLVNFTEATRSADAIATAAYLAKRFNLEKIILELAHISQALRERHWLIGHQIFGEGMIPPEFEKFEDFKKIVISIKEQKSISEISFKINGEEKSYTLTDSLPIYLVESAIAEYIQDNQVEFDTDLVKSKIARTKDGIHVERAKEFNLPEERFLVRFVKAFYNFLLKEVPPAESDYLPSKRYYAIIANMLQMNWYFYQKRDPEWFTIAKVEQWHQLAIKEKVKPK